MPSQLVLDAYDGRDAINKSVLGKGGGELEVVMKFE